MRKVVLGIGIVGIISLMGYTAVTNLPQAEAKSIPKDAVCEQPGHFENSFTYKDNEYCSTTCVVSGDTDFPTEYQTVNVDQTINAGGHFQWEEIRIDTSVECTTNIDYAKWYSDYLRQIEILKNALRNIAREAHQYYTEKVHGDCNLRIYGSGYTTTTNPNTCARWKEEEKVYQNSLAVKKVNEWSPSSSVGDALNYAKSSQIVEKPVSCILDDNDIKKAHDKSCPTGYKPYSGDMCAREICTPYSCKNRAFGESHIGKLIEYNKIKCGDTADTCHSIGTFYYCSYARPTWDNINFDNYWVDVFNQAMRQLKSMGRTGLPGKLKICNESSTDRIRDIMKEPRVIMHYNDPVGVYNDANNLELTKLVEKELTIETTEKVPAADTSVPVLKTIADKLSNDGNSSFSFTSLGQNLNGVKLFTESRSYAYQEYTNTMIKKEGTAKFKYVLPEGFYQFVLKPEGGAVHANKIPSSKLESGQYIDIGYSNYPVHYQTPTSTYPISITYNIPGVFEGDRLYECRYKVKNKIACPEGECPIPPPIEIPPCTGDCCEGDCDPGELYKGLNLIYRPVDLSEPFHYKNGKVRASGENWGTDDVEKYIKTNRGVEDDDVYNQKPIYDFTLTPSAISDIRSYNRSHELSDFRMTCRGKDRNGKTIGTRCSSDFLREYNGKLSASGSCVNASKSNFYRCAGKEVDQDIIAVEKAIDDR